MCYTGTFSLVCTLMGIVNLTSTLHVYKIFMFLRIILMVGGYFPLNLMLYSVCYCYGNMPFCLIIAKGRFKLEVIPVTILATFHLLLEFNYRYLQLVVGLTSYFYIIVQFINVAYDNGVIQAVAYILKGGLLVQGLGLSLCVMVYLYRYMMYSAPEVPEHHKNELKQLHC